MSAECQSTGMREMVSPYCLGGIVQPLPGNVGASRGEEASLTAREQNRRGRRRREQPTDGSDHSAFYRHTDARTRCYYTQDDLPLHARLIQHHCTYTASRQSLPVSPPTQPQSVRCGVAHRLLVSAALLATCLSSRLQELGQASELVLCSVAEDWVKLAEQLRRTDGQTHPRSRNHPCIVVQFGRIEQRLGTYRRNILLTKRSLFTGFLFFPLGVSVHICKSNQTHRRTVETE